MPAASTPPRQRSSRRAGARTWLLVGLLLLAGRSAHALEDGFSINTYLVWGSLTGNFGAPDPATGAFTQATASGVGAGADLALALAAGWALRATGSYTAHLGAINEGMSTLHVGHASLGVSYALDLLRFVPSLDVAPGLYTHTRPDGTTAYEFGVEFGLSLDFLITPRWSVGLMARYHLFVSNVSQFPAYVQLGPRFGWRWP